MPRRVDQAMLDGFFEEVRSYLPRIYHGLETHRSRPSDHQALDEVYRFLHSIKGTASMLSLDEIRQTASDAEERVERALLGQQALDASGARQVRDATQRIGQWVGAVKGLPAIRPSSWMPSWRPLWPKNSVAT